jgi:hypothetical protein
MIGKIHRVCDDLEAIIQGTVMLDIDMGVFSVGDIKDFLSIVIALAVSVDFKLYTHEKALPVKDWGGLVTVIADNMTAFVETSLTIGGILIVVAFFIGTVVIVNDAATFGAVSVMIGITVLTEADMPIRHGILFPDGFAAALTGNGSFLIAIRTQAMTIEVYDFILGAFLRAKIAAIDFFFLLLIHFQSSPFYKI